jgi:hypothetical protein
MSNDWSDEDLRAAHVPLRKEGAERGPDCPSPETMLAALRGEDAEAARLQVLDHVFQCAWCTREFALLQSVSEPSATAAAAPARRAFTGTLVRGLIAASIGAIAFIGVRRLVAPGEEMRGGPGDFALVSPASEGEATATEVGFVWRSVPGAIRYVVEVDAADGSVAFTTETIDTALTTPVAAPPGEYRWWILARLNDGSERRSEARRIRIR